MIDEVFNAFLDEYEIQNVHWLFLRRDLMDIQISFL